MENPGHEDTEPIGSRTLLSDDRRSVHGLRRHTALSVACALLGAVLWYFVGWTKGTIFGFQNTPLTRDLPATLIGFASVLAGVTAGSMYRHLSRLREKGRKNVGWRSLFREVNMSIDFKLAVVGSPIVFAVLVSVTQGIALPGLALFGIEHGFLSPIIVSQFISERSGSSNEE